MEHSVSRLDAFLAAAQGKAGAQIVRQFVTATTTTMRTGGPADLYCEVKSRKALTELVRLAQRSDLPVCILGGGSNVLVSDRGIRGLVLKNQLRRVEVVDPGESEEVLLVAESGASLSKLARTCARRGLRGLEWAASIPGTVGGAVIGNAGAYGGAVSDCLDSIEVLVDAERVETWPRDSLNFAYRWSALKARVSQALPPLIVLAARFRLGRGDAAELHQTILRNQEHRRRTQPSEPSCGSIFKNPPGTSAGLLIERAGLKGQRIGGAQISALHGNWIVNVGHATSADVLALINLVRQRIYQEQAILLVPEMLFLGEWPATPPYMAVDGA